MTRSTYLRSALNTKGEDQDLDAGEPFLEVRLHDGGEVVLCAEIENQPDPESASCPKSRLVANVIGVSKKEIT